jgi:hypothetical protein
MIGDLNMPQAQLKDLLLVFVLMAIFAGGVMVGSAPRKGGVKAALGCILFLACSGTALTMYMVGR